VDDLGGLIGDSGDHAGMRVAEGVDAQAGHQVQVAIAGRVKEVNTFPAVHDNGVTGINGQEAVGVTLKNLLGGGILPKI